MKTLMEMWSNNKHDLSKLKVFGSVAYAHIRHSKQDAKATKCVFIGYQEDVKVFKFWRL